MRKITEVLAEIEAYECNAGDWLALESLIEELWESKQPEQGIEALFRVFERFPTDDGEGVFWSIIHGLETLEYEGQLYHSLKNKPSYMSLIMLKRIQNTGSTTIAGHSISKLIASIKSNPNLELDLIDEI